MPIAYAIDIDEISSLRSCPCKKYRKTPSRTVAIILSIGGYSSNIARSERTLHDIGPPVYHWALSRPSAWELSKMLTLTCNLLHRSRAKRGTRCKKSRHSDPTANPRRIGRLE
jgi:hypothetical protein